MTAWPKIFSSEHVFGVERGDKFVPVQRCASIIDLENDVLVIAALGWIVMQERQSRQAA